MKHYTARAPTLCARQRALLVAAESLPPLLTMLTSTPDELVLPTATALVEYKAAPSPAQYP
jgi:hypothetical protein